ncbi:hypothetical protein SS50377_22399 [Spironucleus salmonicida]|uniref:Uncharacterized protein n=1 Tax=Spironucleus salmonicida TaxID=348837 RepID=V6LCA9_9EUKA|nr:hypothetical protein SS50377_22399 [Spironucleus salmonicida]|eukprot:EST42107.1 Hypothetical protein SS50377_18416 [Spironucleus salmonicida]
MLRFDAWTDQSKLKTAQILTNLQQYQIKNERQFSPSPPKIKLSDPKIVTFQEFQNMASTQTVSIIGLEFQKSSQETTNNESGMMKSQQSQKPKVFIKTKRISTSDDSTNLIQTQDIVQSQCLLRVQKPKIRITPKSPVEQFVSQNDIVLMQKNLLTIDAQHSSDIITNIGDLQQQLDTDIQHDILNLLTNFSSSLLHEINNDFQSQKCIQYVNQLNIFNQQLIMHNNSCDLQTGLSQKQLQKLNYQIENIQHALSMYQQNSSSRLSRYRLDIIEFFKEFTDSLLHKKHNDSEASILKLQQILQLYVTIEKEDIK